MIKLNLDEIPAIDLTPEPINLEPDFVLALGCPLDDEQKEVEHGA